MQAVRPGRVPRHAWPGCGRTGHARLVLAVIVTAALLALMQAPAGAATNPYPSYAVTHISGYDDSYPSAQCNTSTYPPGFVIIGMGGGRPFTTNACLAHEWAAAPGGPPGPSLYFNTGYAGAYARQITSACTSAAALMNVPASPPGTSSHQRSAEVQAWEIGCSEAVYAGAAYTAAHLPGTPAMWWADVETGNSWSTSTTYNDFAIDGIAYGMSGRGTPTGFYSTPAMWNKIAGPGFVVTPAADADWQPASSCAAVGPTGFSGAPLWLVQNGTVTASNGVSFSSDQGCP